MALSLKSRCVYSSVAHASHEWRISCPRLASTFEHNRPVHAATAEPHAVSGRKLVIEAVAMRLMSTTPILRVTH
jgi:hypothetical protein